MKNLRCARLCAVLMVAMSCVSYGDPASATDVPFTNFQGAWQAHKAYEAGDVVTFDGGTYICLVANSTFSPVDHPTHWTLIAPATPPAVLGSTPGSASTGYETAGNCNLASLILIAGNQLPSNYWPAAGQLVAITSNIDLFQLLGTTYGGDGVTTFALPDLRAAAPNGTFYGICVTGVFP